ncbi:hypothetical protein ACGFSD_05000 [Streptomyces caniferus]|uniref:hypothetical protein n=1 Tax=Streptomyces caniferus TaxID=285557 RepID=UPI0037115350
MDDYMADDVYMAGRHAPADSPAHKLYLWIECLHEILDRFVDQFTSEEWKHDYSARELPELEEHLLDFCKGDDGSDSNAMFIESVAVYLGETLLEEAGGRWDWDESVGTDGLPVVCPDPVLGLEPVVPLLVVGQAIKERTGQVFATVARLLRKAVRDRQREHPEWWPNRVPTPWVHYGCLFRAADTAYRWQNAGMIDYLDWWAEEAGGRERWNFTLKSLDLLEALLRESFPTVEDYHEASDEPFWVMAAWYLGKCIVECKDAQWQYRGINPDAPPGTWHAEDCYWAGAVFVNQRLRYDGHAELLPVMLRDVVAGESLRDVVDRFPDRVPEREYVWGEPTWPPALWELVRPEHLETPALPPLTGEELKELEKADDLEGPDWEDNHRLNAWLAERRAAFPAWAEEAGGGTAAWDFSPESLDRLEDLVRGAFRTYEEASVAKDAPFLVGAAWYFGEVQVRECGAVWRWCPRPADEPGIFDVPMVAGPVPEPEDGDEPDEEDPHEDPYEDPDDDLDDEDEYAYICDPMGGLRALFLPESEEGLRNALESYRRRVRAR